MENNKETIQSDILENELHRLKEEYQKPQMSQEGFMELCQKMEDAKMENKKDSIKRTVRKAALTAAILIGTFTILPNISPSIAHAMEQIPVLGKIVEVITFRDYQYESERNNANIEVPELVIDEVQTNADTAEKLERSIEEINAEIKKITDEQIAQFEEFLKNEQGYQDVMVKSEVLATTSDYFTLKLICFQGAGSGYEWHYYYTIDLNTGERLQLKELFKEGADYITPISDSIKKQMQEQMDADQQVHYWLHDEIEALNFKSITDETAFYINEAGNLVMCFNEGDVAPMYMGVVEFEIPAEVLQGIRK